MCSSQAKMFQWRPLWRFLMRNVIRSPEKSVRLWSPPNQRLLPPRYSLLINTYLHNWTGVYSKNCRSPENIVDTKLRHKIESLPIKSTRDIIKTPSISRSFNQNTSTGDKKSYDEYFEEDLNRNDNFQHFYEYLLNRNSQNIRGNWFPNLFTKSRNYYFIIRSKMNG